MKIIKNREYKALCDTNFSEEIDAMFVNAETPQIKAGEVYTVVEVRFNKRDNVVMLREEPRSPNKPIRYAFVKYELFDSIFAGVRREDEF